MPLSLAFVFAFTQHLSEFSLTASQACYRGLVRVLRAHPRLKFNLYFSGTLIHALNWLDPELLDEVRQGEARGQFELLGGPYAGNILAATNDWENAKQIELHRQTVRAVFGTDPHGCWNPGGAWRQALVPVLAQAGCGWTLVDDHLLHKSGAQHPYAYTTQAEGHRLTVFYADNVLRHRLNYAAWTGRNKQALDYLRRVEARPESRRFCVAYAGEAEALGLWHWQAGLAPQQVWANLDAFLSQVAAQRNLKTVLLSRAPAPAQDLTPIVEGGGAALDEALWQPGAPSHEEGYEDWADFIARAPKFRRFERLHASLRGRIRRVAAEENPPAPRREAEGAGEEATDYTTPPPTDSPLLQQAVHTLTAHQYRLGFPGVGKAGYRGWEGARTAFVSLRAAELAAKARTGLWFEDANGDGSDELFMCDGRQLAVVTPYGARLLFWFDLVEGRQWIGNQLAVTDTPFQADSSAPQIQPQPRAWVPEDANPALGPLRAHKVKEAPPTRLGAYLPDWVWEGGGRDVTLYTQPPAPEGTMQPLRAGLRGLNDRVALAGGEVLEPGPGDYRMEGDTVVFDRHLGPDIELVKRFSLVPEGILVNYRMENWGSEQRQVELRVATELCPDYREALNGGRASLEYVLVNDNNPGVRNNRTGRAVYLAATRPWTQLERTPGLFALEVAQTFAFDLSPQMAQAFDLKLMPIRLQILGE